MDYTNEVIIGAMLHDIGKFFNDCGGGVICGVDTFKSLSASHPITSYLFVKKYEKELGKLGLNTDAIEEIVLWHHGGSKEKKALELYEIINKHKKSAEYANLCNIVHKADGISSQERLLKHSKDDSFKDSPFSDSNLRSTTLRSKYLLSSIFTYYKFNESSRSDFKIKNDKLGIAGTSMNNKPDIEVNKQAIERFDKEFNTLVNHVSGIEEFIQKLNNLLFRYTSCTVSAANEEFQTISLYNHLITTAAIANVLYNDGEKICKIYNLYYEGIDDFLQNQSSIDNIAVALEFIDKTMNNIVDNVCSIAGINKVCCVINGSTNKLLLTPYINKDAVEAYLNTIIKKVWEQTDGKLRVCANSTEMSPRDMDIIGEKHQWLSKLLNHDKAPEFCIENILTKDNKWQSIKIEEAKLENYNTNTNLDINSKYYTLIRFKLEETKDTIVKKILNGDVLHSHNSYIVNSMIGTITSEGYDYTSISRYVTALNSLAEALKYTSASDSDYVCTLDNEIIVITQYSNVLEVIDSIKNRFNTITCNKLGIQAIVEVFNHSEELSIHYRKTINKKWFDGIIFDGVEYSWDEYKELYNFIKLLDNEKDNINSSTAYRLIDTLDSVIKYTEDGNANHISSVGRLKYYIYKQGINNSGLVDKILNIINNVINESDYNFILGNIPNLIKYSLCNKEDN